MTPPQPERPILFYDGGCPLCRREIRLYRKLDRQHRIDWRDLLSETALQQQYGLDPDQAMRELHLLDQNGQWQRGVDAFIAVWQRLPGFRLAGRIARWPPIYRLLSWGYRRFAQRRYQQRCTIGCPSGDLHTSIEETGETGQRQRQ